MPSSCQNAVPCFKSTASVVIRFLWRSRETQSRRSRMKTDRIREVEERLEKEVKEHQKTRERLAQLEFEASCLRIKCQQLQRQPPILPDDVPLPNHKFGPKMIALCINLARRVGFRGAADVLALVMEWLASP